MLDLIKRDLPGVLATNWANNTLIIKLVGNVYWTFHAIPEYEHTNFLKSSNPLEYLKVLQEKYPINEHDHKLG